MNVSEPAAMFGRVTGGVIAVRRRLDGQRKIDATVTHVKLPAKGDRGGRDALGDQRRLRLRFQRREFGVERRDSTWRVIAVDTAGRVSLGVRQPDAVSAQQAGVRMTQNPLDTQFLGNRAGMLSRRAAERDEHIVRRIAPLGERDPADRLRHLRVGDPQKPGRQLVATRTRQAGGGHRVGDFVQPPSHRVPAERKRETIGQDAAEPHVRVGHSERPAAAVTGGSRIGAGTIRAHGQPDAIEAAQRTAARRHGFDRHHRRNDSHPRLFRFEFPLVAAVEPGDIGAGAAHVEAKRTGKPGRQRHAGEADYAARRPRQQTIAPSKRLGFDKSTGRSEQPQVGTRSQRFPQAGNIVGQHRVQIGIDDGRVTAGDQLDERSHFVRQANLRKTGRPGDPPYQPLVFRLAIAVQKTNGDRPQVGTTSPQRRELLGDKRWIKRLNHRSVDRHPFSDFQHIREQRFRFANRQLEQPRPVLIADAKNIRESRRGHKHGRRAAASEQGIRAACRAQPHGYRRKRFTQRQPQQPADRQHRRFDREQFVARPERRHGGQRPL